MTENYIYKDKYNYPDFPLTKFNNKIYLYKDTTMNIAKFFYDLKENVTILNFASATNPGGGFLKGSNAQEESICYSSNLYNNLLLSQEYYSYNRKFKNPLYSDYMIFTKNVSGFRDNMYNLTSPYIINVLTVPAVMAKICRDRGTKEELINLTMESRIEKLIKNLIINKSETIILGAFGSGAFGNNPYEVAKAFHKILIDKGLGNNFKRIVFAIYDNKNDYNYIAYYKTFKKYI